MNHLLVADSPESPLLDPEYHAFGVARSLELIDTHLDRARLLDGPHTFEPMLSNAYDY